MDTDIRPSIVLPKRSLSLGCNMWPPHPSEDPGPRGKTSIPWHNLFWFVPWAALNQLSLGQRYDLLSIKEALFLPNFVIPHSVMSAMASGPWRARFVCNVQSRGFPSFPGVIPSSVGGNAPFTVCGTSVLYKHCFARARMHLLFVCRPINAEKQRNCYN